MKTLTVMTVRHGERRLLQCYRQQLAPWSSLRVHGTWHSAAGMALHPSWARSHQFEAHYLHCHFHLRPLGRTGSVRHTGPCQCRRSTTCPSTTQSTCPTESIKFILDRSCFREPLRVHRGLQSLHRTTLGGPTVSRPDHSRSPLGGGDGFESSS
ncbi:hypothetical protein BJV78DRAFT_1242421 [Lactifluus subvellereus]|nr:hypothetical protein BJV78DRAFT_1242421 [Lactifluus subvellereus]